MKLACALLCVCVRLAAGNWEPCLPSNSADGYRLFLKRHLSSGTPDGLEHQAWEDHLRDSTDCEMSLQSFLRPSDRKGVEDICRPEGGKQRSGNHCISKNKFTFISVHSDVGTCAVRNVTRVTMEITVACDMVDEVCRPTHLEEYPTHWVPRSGDMDCGLLMSDHSLALRATGQLCLLLSLLALALCFSMA